MNKQNIEQIIKDLFKQNYELYPENYPDIADSIDTAKQAAAGYWDVRTSEEEQRDARPR